VPSVGPPSASDEALLIALREGELAAFDELHRRWARRLYGYVLRHVGDAVIADDLFQDVFLTVLRDRSYDPARGRFAAWLFALARNRCLDQRRADERRAHRSADMPDEPPAQHPIALGDPEETLARAQQGRTVRAAIAGLPEAQRQLLILKQVGGLTYREIGEMHGIPEGTVKSRLHAAVSAFRRALTGEPR
jgi:RNA polymerase sigma-70 factor, ECF subfamily